MNVKVLAWRLDHPLTAPGAALRARLETLVGALTGAPAPASGAELVAAFEQALSPGDPADVWLTLAVLRAELPLDAHVVAHARAVRLDGPLAAFRDVLRPSVNPLERRRQLRRVEVVEDAVLVDLAHTSRSALATGIQRVARQTARRWAAEHDVTFVGWTADESALRRLTDEEVATGLHGRQGPDGRAQASATVLVPHRSTYVLPELAVEPRRTQRLLALALRSGCRTGAIGFDCVPLSTAETIGAGMGSAFAGNLAAVRHFDTVVAISHAAATEYRGWRRMLAGTGLAGPRIEVASLPVEAQRPDRDAVDRCRSRFGVDEMPLVLVVGSHEPRKNHVAVLQAAELAWQSGARFRLLFVGGNAWGAAPFEHRLQELAEAGRPVESVRALSDDDLWACYALARCVVFPSLNEGFGLPVAEAIALGTPVITSDFGSMREISDGVGAILVDPRDDDAIADALRRLVTDDALRARLSADALTVPRGSWDAYARATWAPLVGGGPNR